MRASQSGKCSAARLGRQEQQGAPVDDLVVAELEGQPNFRQSSSYPQGVAQLTSTKLDWYFWSLGAIRRWTSPRSRTWRAGRLVSSRPSALRTSLRAEAVKIKGDVPSRHPQTVHTTC